MVVETVEPVCASVRSQRPLTNPDRVFNILGWLQTVSVIVTVSHDILFELGAEANVLMSVEHNIVHIVIREQAIPSLRIEMVRLVEDEDGILSVCAEYLSHILVVPLKKTEVGSSKRFIDWLESHKGWIWSKVLDDFSDLVKGINDVLRDNSGVSHGLLVPFSHPVC